MAVKIERYMTDDLAALESPQGRPVIAELTVRFSVEGAEYEIDLSAANRERFLGAIGPFVQAARRVKGKVRQRSGAQRGDSVRVREWARENDVEVNGRGRIPAAVMKQYKETASA